MLLDDADAGARNLGHFEDAHAAGYRAWSALTILVALLAALIAAVVSIHDMMDIQNAISNSHGLVSIGWGLWVDCLASVSAIVALGFFWRADSKQRPVPQPPLVSSE